MAEIVQFVPKAELDARGNLTAFIRLCREELSAFGGLATWDEDRWQDGKAVVVFGTKTAPLTSYSFVPLAEPFKQFAKAYIRYDYSHRPVVSLSYRIQALRCVEAALRDSPGPVDIQRITGAVMDASAQKCREFATSDDFIHKTGLDLVKLFDFLRRNHLVPSLPAWKSPFRKPTILTEDLGEAGREHREKKLPSHAAMLAMAEVFAEANDKESRYFSSIMALLMTAPSRGSEPFKLPTNCLQWEADDNGEQQMLFRWRAAKGKGAMKKWIVAPMHSVMEEAHRRLMELGEPARLAAKFAFENPGKFLIHAGCITAPDHPQDAPLSPEEFCAAIGLKVPKSIRRRDGTENWSAIKVSKPFAAVIASGEVTYARLADVVRQVYGGAHWPYTDATRQLLIWDALCLHRENEFHAEFSPKAFSWRLADVNEVNRRMQDSHGPSLFARFGKTNPEGSRIEMTTHQPRHWLNTMGVRTGMDDYTLAQWAGRADPRHNRHYDHRTPEERASEARALIIGERPSVLERFRDRKPVHYTELGVDRPGTAKVTLYGLCTHDYSMMPCEKRRKCLTCTELTCIKGDHITLDRIRLAEAQTAWLLERAQKAHEDGEFGADRWVDNHKWELAHQRAIRITLEHPDVPDGALVRIPEGHDPSPIKRALIDLGVHVIPATEVATPPIVSLPSKLPEDA